MSLAVAYVTLVCGPQVKDFVWIGAGEQQHQVELQKGINWKRADHQRRSLKQTTALETTRIMTHNQALYWPPSFRAFGTKAFQFMHFRCVYWKRLLVMCQNTVARMLYLSALCRMCPVQARPVQCSQPVVVNALRSTAQHGLP